MTQGIRSLPAVGVLLLVVPFCTAQTTNVRLDSDPPSSESVPPTTAEATTRATFAPPLPGKALLIPGAAKAVPARSQ